MRYLKIIGVSLADYKPQHRVRHVVILTLGPLPKQLRFKPELDGYSGTCANGLTNGISTYHVNYSLLIAIDQGGTVNHEAVFGSPFAPNPSS